MRGALFWHRIVFRFRVGLWRATLLLSQLRDHCRSAAGISLPSVLEALEECWSCLLSYMAFTDLRECCICRDIVTPRDRLVSSDSGPHECRTKHVFHEDCLPPEYAFRHGCPVCRRPISALQDVVIDPLFRLHPAE